MMGKELDALRYHKARVSYLEQLLDGVLTPKQRREAQAEHMHHAVKSYRAKSLVEAKQREAK